MGEQTAASICFPIRFGLWSVWSSPIRHRSGYGAQVGRKDSPAHPSTEALLASIPTSAQVFAALHDADASLNPSPKPPRSFEPPLPLVFLALGTLLACFGQAHLLYLHLLRYQFVLFGMHVAVRRHQLRHLAEQSEVIIEGRSELSFIACVALEYPKPAHDAPFHLREPHHPTKLGLLLACLAPAYLMAVCSSKMESSFCPAETCSPSNTLRWVCQTARLRSPAKWEISSEIFGAEGRSSSILRTRSACFMLYLATSTNLW